MIKDWYTSEDLKKRMAKEMSIEQLTEGNDRESNYDMLHFLIRNQKNYKKPKQQKITAKDLQRDDLLGRVLQDYDRARELHRERLNDGDGTKFLRSRAIYQINQDMIYTKGSMLGVFGYHTFPQESTIPDLDTIDLSNPAHVKVLLPMHIEFDPNNELSFIFLDLEELIEKALIEEEKLVVDMLRDQFSIKEIAETIGLNYKQTQYKIRKISEKVAHFCGRSA